MIYMIGQCSFVCHALHALCENPPAGKECAFSCVSFRGHLLLLWCNVTHRSILDHKSKNGLTWTDRHTQSWKSCPMTGTFVPFKFRVLILRQGSCCVPKIQDVDWYSLADSFVQGTYWRFFLRSFAASLDHGMGWMVWAHSCFQSFESITFKSSLNLPFEVVVLAFQLRLRRVNWMRDKEWHTGSQSAQEHTAPMPGRMPCDNRRRCISLKLGTACDLWDESVICSQSWSVPTTLGALPTMV